jgi:hypothetical protein
MRKMVFLILPAVSLALFCLPARAGQPVDYSRPFPLSLLEYSTDGGERNPWPLDVLNIQINSDSTTQVQNEEMVAINPQNTDNAVAIWRDFRLGFRRVGIGYTFDAGMTWHDTLLVVPPYPWQSDPVLAVDSSGNFFACTLCLRSTREGPTGIYVQKSTDGGMTWSSPVVAVDSAFAYFEDKQMMVLDADSGATYGNVYISWTRFTSDLSSSDIALIRSTDGGASYSDPIIISDNPDVQWSVPAAGPDGEVFVAWFQYFPRGIVFDVSYDQGQTFGDDRLIAPTSIWPEEINGNIMVFPFPALVCDIGQASPFRGNLYMAYMNGTSTDMDILFRESTDGGGTWSSAIRLNDDDQGNGCDQFHPWLSVDETGWIHAIFYDRRLDEGRNLLFDLYYTRSTDGGLSWSPNERITTVSSDPGHAALAGLIGEYIGLSAWENEVQMAWTDTRNGNQDVFSGRMDLTSAQENVSLVPDRLSITGLYPNPFNSGTVIRYQAAESGPVRLDIVDLLGRTVRGLYSGDINSGPGRITWDGLDDSGLPVASGVYFVRLNNADLTATKKAVLIR